MARPKNIRELNDEVMGVNPFMDDVYIPVRRKKKEDFKDEYEIFESGHYLKLFEDTGYRKRMLRLTARGKEMLLYILHYLPRGKDYMGIDRTEYMDRNNIKSPHTFLSAIKELDDVGFISLKPFMKDIFFINPKLFFNGSRVNRFPNNLTIKPWSKNKEDENSINEES